MSILNIKMIKNSSSDFSALIFSVSIIVNFVVFFIIIPWLYFSILESSQAQATYGKRLMKIIVTDLNGHKISFGRATLRHFGHYLSFFTFLIGYLMQPFTKKRQALHDIIAGTLVIKVNKNNLY